jgi:hypothetical protein
MAVTMNRELTVAFRRLEMVYLIRVTARSYLLGSSPIVAAAQSCDCVRSLNVAHIPCQHAPYPQDALQ